MREPGLFRGLQATAVVEGDTIMRLAEGPLHPLFGICWGLLYDDAPQESIALVIGQVEQGTEG
jgi:hypothetical protein